jgi:hypothetical protein
LTSYIGVSGPGTGAITLHATTNNKKSKIHEGDNPKSERTVTGNGGDGFSITHTNACLVIGFAGIDRGGNDLIPHSRNDRVFAESVIVRPRSDPDLALQREWGPVRKPLSSSGADVDTAPKARRVGEEAGEGS